VYRGSLVVTENRFVIEDQPEPGVVNIVSLNRALGLGETAWPGRDHAPPLNRGARRFVIKQGVGVRDRHVVGAAHQVDKLVLRHGEIERGDEQWAIGGPFGPYAGDGERVQLSRSTFHLKTFPARYGALTAFK
jgi:hypothetical protein